MKIALAQINTTIGDFEGNLKLILEYVRRAAKQKADLVIFPELTLTGYPPKDLLERPDFIEANLKTLEKLRQKITHPACLVGFVNQRKAHQGKPLANAVALIHRKKILKIKHKQLLPTYDVFDEERYFEPDKNSELFNFLGYRIGVSICEDMWVDPQNWSGRQLYINDPIQEQAQEGVEFFINLSASPYSMGKRKLRNKVLRAQAKKYGVPFFYANLVGGNDDLVFDGASSIYNKKGQLVKRLKGFVEDLVVVDLENLRPQKEPKEKKEQLVLASLILGLKDYLKKCGFERVVLGLSGGIDSALTAWVAVEAIGSKNVLGINMPSPYSSVGSVKDSEALAKALNIDFKVIPIGGLYEQYRKVLGFDKEKKIDITLQNIQARIRGNLLMSISNREGRLLLSTGNKSELSVGYCTLYGDMAGGLSVLSDVPKTLVYKLARLANRKNKAIPLASFRKAPSAELAPKQKDQDELPPYEILDPILSAYLEEQKTPQEIIARGYPKATVLKILQLLDRNEYKRMQAAPGIRVTSKAFGYGRRVPIASRYRIKK